MSTFLRDESRVPPVEFARLRRPAGEHVVEHDRPAMAISFRALPNSEVRMRSAGRTALVATRRGTHCFMPAGTVVAGQWRSPTDYLLGRFRADGLVDALGTKAAAAAQQGHRCAEDPRVLSLSSLIADELECKGAHGRLYLDALTAALTLALFPRGEVVREAEAAPRLRRAIDFIHSHLADDVSIDDLAAEACLSRFHFTRLFTSATGKSPYRYVIEQRLQLARTLLGASTFPIAEVARRCGFNSAAHFTRLFSREVGMSPSDFRGRS